MIGVRRVCVVIMMGRWSEDWVVPTLQDVVEASWGCRWCRGMWHGRELAKECRCIDICRLKLSSCWIVVVSWPYTSATSTFASFKHSRVFISLFYLKFGKSARESAVYLKWVYQHPLWQLATEYSLCNSATSCAAYRVHATQSPSLPVIVHLGLGSVASSHIVPSRPRST